MRLGFLEIAGMAGVGLLVLSVATGDGRSAIAEFNAKNDAAKAESDRIERVASNELKARERYENGAVLIVLRSNGKPVGLSATMPVVDRETGLPLPAGTVVCDLLGNTAVLDGQGLPTDIYFTGDMAVVKAAAQRQGVVLGGGLDNG